MGHWASCCGPRVKMAAVIGELAGGMEGRVPFTKATVDGNPEIARRSQVRFIPTFGSSVGDGPVGAMVGAHPEAMIRQGTDQIRTEVAPIPWQRDGENPVRPSLPLRSRSWMGGRQWTRSGLSPRGGSGSGRWTGCSSLRRMGTRCGHGPEGRPGCETGLRWRGWERAGPTLVVVRP